MIGFEDFVRNLVSDYWDARALLHPHPKASRGTARVVSSLAEERLTACILRAHPKIDHIYVDQEVRFPGLPVRKPDLCVVRAGAITLTIDLKMDLGRLRDKLPQLVQANLAWIAEAGSAMAALSVRSADDPATRRKVLLRMAAHSVHAIVIVSGQNIPKADLRELLRAWSGNELVPVLVLWPDTHPNDPRFATREDAVSALLQGVDTAAVERLNELCLAAAA